MTRPALPRSWATRGWATQQSWDPTPQSAVAWGDQAIQHQDVAAPNGLGLLFGRANGLSRLESTGVNGMIGRWRETR